MDFDGQELYSSCCLCPRACGVDRSNGKLGVCGAGATVRIGRAALHWWEEPPLVGDRGSGAVFFSSCPLGCVYCQNKDLAKGAGVDVPDGSLDEVFLRLQDSEGAANINLVTPSHYAPTIAASLRCLRETGKLRIPVVFNTSSYEAVSTLRLFDGLVDVYLADFKYVDSAEAHLLSRAADYPAVARKALEEMIRQVPVWEEDGEGMLFRGVIVRHLVLPGRIEASLRALDALLPLREKMRLSIMSQYTPLSGDLARYGLQGRVSRGDYERVLDYADFLGFEDYFWQEGGAAEESFVPAFDGTGVLR